jgi:hypothetical protein
LLIRNQDKRIPTTDIHAPPAPHLDSIPEDPDAGDSGPRWESGFKGILQAEGDGWPGIPTPKELDGVSDAIVLFVSLVTLSANSSFIASTYMLGDAHPGV